MTTTQPTISPVLRYQDGPAAIDWLVRAFGFQKHSVHTTPDGAIAHADLRFGTERDRGELRQRVAPCTVHGRSFDKGSTYASTIPTRITIARTRAGAEIVIPLKDMDYGSRDFSMRDLDGHLWGFGTYNMGADEWRTDAVGRSPLSRRPPPPSHGSSVRLDSNAHWKCQTIEAGSSTQSCGWARACSCSGPRRLDSEWPDVHQVVSLRVDDPDGHFARRQGGWRGRGS